MSRKAAPGPARFALRYHHPPPPQSDGFGPNPLGARRVQNLGGGGGEAEKGVEDFQESQCNSCFREGFLIFFPSFSFKSSLATRRQCRRTATGTPAAAGAKAAAADGAARSCLPGAVPAAAGGTGRSVLPPSLQSPRVCQNPAFSPSPPPPPPGGRHLRHPPSPRRRGGCSRSSLPPARPSPAVRRGGGGTHTGTGGGGRLQPAGGAGPAPGGRAERGGGCHWPRRGATPARLPHASDTGARRGYLRHPPAPPLPLRARPPRRAHAVRGAAARSALGPGAAPRGGGRGGGGKARPCARSSAASCWPWPWPCCSPAPGRRRALRPPTRRRGRRTGPRSRRGACPCRTQVREGGRERGGIKMGCPPSPLPESRLEL